MTSNCTPVTMRTPRQPHPTHPTGAWAAFAARLDRWAAAVLQASRSPLERFLGEAVDHADLEDRMRRWHAAEGQGGWIGRAR
jgi:hypothetical protein